MLNRIWLGMVVVAFICAVFTGHIPDLVNSVAKNAKLGFEMAFNLTGLMCFWLGLMKIAESAGVIKSLARGIEPLMLRLFPSVPHDHPAMGAMILNIAANVLGLGNAATPFGLRAMEALESLNPNPGVATNAMCMLLALNTSSLQLIPVSGMAFLAAGGAQHPQDIILTTILATSCSTLAAVFVVPVLAKLPRYAMSAQ